MNRDLLGRRGHWLFASPATLGYLVRVPVTVVGFGRGRVKVRARRADGSTVTRYVEESHLQVRTVWGRKSRTVHCKHPGCPAQFVNPYRLEAHEGTPHTRCSCGRHFTDAGLARHLGQCKRRGIEHP